MRRALAVLFLISAPSLAGQAPPRDGSSAPPAAAVGTATIRGRIFAAGTGDPIRNARVAVSSGDLVIPPVLADRDGRFELASLPAGTYTLTASKPGFAKAAFGARAAGGSGAGLQVAAGAVLDDVNVGLLRGAALTGVVLDDSGDPVLNTNVVVERVVEASDARTRAEIVGSTQTDDRGEYRFGDLVSGVYVVSVRTGEFIITFGDRLTVATDGNADRARRTYFPGAATLAGAQRLDLRPGDEKSGIDLTTSDSRVLAQTLADDDARRALAGVDPKTIAVVRGTVARPDGRAMRGAQVVLVPAGSVGRTRLTLTGADGSYEFLVPAPEPADYRVVADGAGFLRTGYGAARGELRGTPIPIQAGDVHQHIDVTLSRAGAISGRIVDEYGDPIEAAAVRLMQVRYGDGRRQLADVGVPQRTDDLGRFRLPALVPGDYLVGASVGQIVGTQSTADLPGYGTTYFPGTLTPSDAQFVRVGAAADVTVDFALMREKTARVMGKAFDAAGNPVSGGIGLIPTYRSGSIGSTTLGARIERDGRFEFSNVPPGDYVVQVVRGRQSSNGNDGEFAYQYVTVADRDVTGLVLQTAAGSTISGQITTDSGASAKLADVVLTANPVDPDRSPLIGGPPVRAHVDEDGSFEVASVSGPRRLAVQRVPDGWMLKSVLVNGVDATDAPLPFGRADQSLSDVTVVLTARISKVTGSVTDARGRGAPDAVVVAFPTDRTLWYPRSRYFGRTTSDASGAFKTPPLPPADYFVVALDRASTIAAPGEGWQDPDALDRVSRGAPRLTLGEGQIASVDLRIR